jgi:wyosine [tRNA(Phe)-imidazoG37] synthetase (radical SAM superfamily)
MKGEFVVADKKNFENDIFELLRNFKHINLSYENCSVCAEFTETKTACNHSLCIYCWDKIKKSKKTGVKPCPICRKAMEYKHRDEDE